MTQIWKSQSQFQIIVTHSGTNYTLDATSIIVRRHENGFDTGTVILEDTEAKNYVDKVIADDAIEIKQKDASDASWATLLKGVIRRVEPVLSAEGNLLKVECDGGGYGLAMTKCGQEYGLESSNPSLDTIKEMIEDATNGIIPKWVNKLLGTGIDSGYSYTTQIEAIAGSIPYVYFPYKYCHKVMNDICDIVQAIKGANAGPHWIIDTSDRVLVATIGNHGLPASTYWPTWWRTDAVGSTLEEGKDFLHFRFQQLAKESNYVLYYGRFSRPGTGDFWTENNKALWGKTAAMTLTDDNSAGNYKVGSYSLKASMPTPGDMLLYYPLSADANWDATKWGGKYNIPRVNFWVKRDANTNDNFQVRLVSTAGAYFYKSISLSVDIFTFCSLQIGDYYDRGENYTIWNKSGLPVWTEIDDIQFMITPSVDPGVMWIDNVHFSGWILRGARPTSAYSSTNPLKMKLITDNMAKDDSGIAADDSGVMGRLCYAEYLRQQSTPIVGTFTTPIANDILPGQKIHVHAKKKGDGTFQIDKDFRVIRPVHNISNSGPLTNWEVTDDLTNANPRPMPTQLNVLLGAIRPEFQDRQATSIKTRDIDITQAILEKSY